MSRSEGFDVMDVSTALPNDPKVKRLAREFPAQLGPGFLVYVSTMAESWKAGERVSYDDAWPGYLDFDQATVDALQAVRLLDPKGRVTLSGWRGFFEQARDRRENSRERWRRANAKRAADHASVNGTRSADAATIPRGSHAVTGAIPSDSDSVRPNGDSPPPTPAPGRGREKRRATGRPLSERAQALDARMIRAEDADLPDWLGEPAEKTGAKR